MFLVIVFDSYFKILDDPNVDEFYTFDEEEAEKYHFSWNTTYYSKRVQLPESKIQHDILFLGRAKDREDGANFFLFLANANIKRIAIENPVGIMSTR